MRRFYKNICFYSVIISVPGVQSLNFAVVEKMECFLPYSLVCKVSYTNRDCYLALWEKKLRSHIIPYVYRAITDCPPDHLQTTFFGVFRKLRKIFHNQVYIALRCFSNINLAFYMSDRYDQGLREQLKNFHEESSTIFNRSQDTTKFMHDILSSLNYILNGYAITACQKSQIACLMGTIQQNQTKMADLCVRWSAINSKYNIKQLWDKIKHELDNMDPIQDANKIQITLKYRLYFIEQINKLAHCLFKGGFSRQDQVGPGTFGLSFLKP